MRGIEFPHKPGIGQDELRLAKKGWEPNTPERGRGGTAMLVGGAEQGVRKGNDQRNTAAGRVQTWSQVFRKSVPRTVPMIPPYMEHFGYG